MGALTTATYFAIMCFAHGVNGREDFGIFVEFDNACDKVVRVWLNSDQAAGDIAPGETGVFPVCTDPDCTQAWGLPEAFSYQYGAQTIEGEPCTLEGGKGEVTVSATAPVRVFRYHELVCDVCENRAGETNAPKQMPMQADTTKREQDDAVQMAPAANTYSPLPLPSPLTPLPPQLPSVAPVEDTVDERETTPMSSQLPPQLPQQEESVFVEEEEGETTYIPEGGNLFAFGGTSIHDTYAMIAVLLALAL